MLSISKTLFLLKLNLPRFYFQQDVVEKKSGKAPTTSHLKRVSELEELAQEQDIALTALMDRVKAANADIRKQKQTIDNIRRQAEKERNKYDDQNSGRTS